MVGSRFEYICNHVECHYIFITTCISICLRLAGIFRVFYCFTYCTNCHYILPAFFRRLKITTAYEYLEKRFHIVVRVFGSASFVLFQLARMGIVVYLPALAISTVTGIDIYMAIILMGLLAILYTVMGVLKL